LVLLQNCTNADDNSKSIIENALKKTFAPELNKLMMYCVQHAKHDIDLIIEIELKKLYARLTDLDTINSF
jgi:ATP-dependent Clp protease ATP-binding subunit ClpC